MRQYEAQYIGKTYDRNGYDVHLFYRYRGHEYMITKHKFNTVETLRSQHQQEQKRIDRIIEEETKPQKPYRYEDTADYAMEQFMKMVEG